MSDEAGEVQPNELHAHRGVVTLAKIQINTKFWFAGTREISKVQEKMDWVSFALQQVDKKQGSAK